MPRYTTTVAHELGKDEALARLRAVTAQARTVSDLQGDWQAGTLDFSVTAQGLRIAARITVEDDRLTFDGTLPLIAMPFRSWIPRVLKKSLQMQPGQAAAPEPAPPAATEPTAEPAAPVVLFLHIPKAGGQTLGELVYAHTRAETASDDDVLKAGVAYLTYGFLKERPFAVPEYALPLLRRRDLRAVIGHFWFGLHEHVARPSVYVTALRDPVERVLSLYYYTRLHDSITLEEFIAEPPFREVDNDQTRRIAGVDPEIGGCTPAMLRTAQENLRRFVVAGTIERLDEMLPLLQRSLGWQGPLVCHPRNVNAERPASASLPRQTIEAIRQRNELDFELWRYASQLMDEAIAAGDGA
ncbi:MAG: hypothetical protein QOF89_1134 [Acidobacteriota bacterium]|jgi:hypothetical protein|nr:hypothetical protein [Acidobacteriota bacterium]